jgi:hypothetical protein
VTPILFFEAEAGGVAPLGLLPTSLFWVQEIRKTIEKLKKIKTNNFCIKF